MAISELGTKISGNSNSSNSRTDSHTLVAGDDRIVIVGAVGTDSSSSDRVVTSVTYGGQSCTEVINRNDTSNNINKYISFWYILEANLPSDGANDVVVNTSGTIDHIELICHSFQDAAQQAPTPTATASIENDATPSTNITTNNDDTYLLDLLGTNNDTATLGKTADSPQTSTVFRDTGVEGHMHSQKLVGTAASTSMGWGGNFSAGDDHNHIIIGLESFSTQSLTFPLVTFTPSFFEFNVNQQLDFALTSFTPVFHSFTVTGPQQLDFSLVSFTPEFFSFNVQFDQDLTFPLVTFSPEFFSFSVLERKKLVFTLAEFTPVFYGFRVGPDFLNITPTGSNDFTNITPSGSSDFTRIQ